jgi:hypothetical protein
VNDHVLGASAGGAGDRSWPPRWIHAVAFVLVALGASMLVMGMAFALLATLRIAYTTSSHFTERGPTVPDRASEQASSVPPSSPKPPALTVPTAPGPIQELATRTKTETLKPAETDAPTQPTPSEPVRAASAVTELSSLPDTAKAGALPLRAPTSAKDAGLGSEQVVALDRNGSPAVDATGRLATGPSPVGTRIDPQPKPHPAVKRHPKVPRHVNRKPARVGTWPLTDPFQPPAAANRAPTNFR